MASVANVRRIGVFISADSATKPVEADYDPTTIARKWGVRAGSHLWFAELESDLAAQERRLENMAIQPGSTRQVEIWEIDPDAADIRVTPLFWGEIVGQRMDLTAGSEREWLLARMEPYHFGDTITGQRVKTAAGDKIDNIPIAFNPMIDGKIVFNQWRPTGHTQDWDYWIDPESTRSAKALKYQDGGGAAVNTEWTLQSICETLCLIGNGGVVHILNPVHATIAPPFADAPKVRNLVLATGEYLPQYLDAVTHRYGWNWTVDHYKNLVDGTLRSRIRFFQQMKGAEQTVKMQAVGSVCDLSSTNTTHFGLVADVGTLFNVVTGYGALIEREMSLPLFRAWPTANDGDEDHEDVHNYIGRKWIANEGGDYTAVRAEITAPLIIDAGWTVKRRVLEDCLTLRDGVRRPPFLEYRETPADEWKPVPTEWGWRILPTELGIYFTGQREVGGSSGGIPEAVLTSDVELSITATVRGDTRPTYTQTASLALTPNPNYVEKVIDLSDRFFDRARMTGTLASVLTGAADVADDSTLLEEYIDKVTETVQLAEVSANITLFGLHFYDEYIIGDLITTLAGRDISLNRSADPGTPRYVQIVGITHTNMPGQQSTELTVSPHGVI